MLQTNTRVAELDLRFNTGITDVGWEALLGMLRASLRAWLESGGELDLLELRRVAFERLERGLRR